MRDSQAIQCIVAWRYLHQWEDVHTHKSLYIPNVIHAGRLIQQLLRSGAANHCLTLMTSYGAKSRYVIFTSSQVSKSVMCVAWGHWCISRGLSTLCQVPSMIYNTSQVTFVCGCIHMVIANSLQTSLVGIHGNQIDLWVCSCQSVSMSRASLTGVWVVLLFSLS